MCLLFLVPRRWFFSPTHKGSINGRRLVPPLSRSGYALRLGAMIRLTSSGGHKRRYHISVRWVFWEVGS